MKRGMQGKARRARLAEGSEQAPAQPFARVFLLAAGWVRNAASPLSEVTPKGKPFAATSFAHPSASPIHASPAFP